MHFAAKRLLEASFCFWLLVGASGASGQGLFDVITNAIVDVTNESIGATPSPEVRRLQVDAARVALRGSDSDWESFIGSATAAVGAGSVDLLNETRSLARTEDRVRQAVVGRDFLTPSGTYWQTIHSYAMGRVDPTHELLPIVISLDRDDPDPTFPSVYVLEPDFSKIRHYPDHPPSMGVPAVYERSALPGTPLDIDGDGVEEILYIGLSFFPRVGFIEQFLQSGTLFVWRTDQNEHLLRRDELGQVMFSDASYVHHNIPVSGYSSVFPENNAPRRNRQELVQYEVERGPDRDRLLLHLWQWPELSEYGRVAAPRNTDLGQPVPWEAGTHIWTKEVRLVDGELILEVVQSYVPDIDETVPYAVEAIESRQWIELVGAGFARETIVTFLYDSERYEIPPERFEFIDETRIRVLAGIFPADADPYRNPKWYVSVENPGGIVSAPFPLWTVAPEGSQ